MPEMDHTVEIRIGEGPPLDSELLVVAGSADMATVLVKSAGGGVPPRNPDYSRALDELLRRALVAGFALDSVRVVSSTANDFPEESPEIDIGGYPVRAGESGVSGLRSRIQTAVAGKFQRPGARGGNSQKKTELDFSSAGRGSALAEILSGASSGSTAVDGADYRADEEVVVTLKDGKPSLDASAREEGLRRHATAQNLLLNFVIENRFVQTLVESNVDVAWTLGESASDDELWLAEVKGLTEGNERGQPRLGLGQIIDFVDHEVSLGRAVRGVLFVSQQPSRERWVDKCARAGIVLSWPGNWPPCTGRTSTDR